jgi:hypothetical protein
LPPGSQGKPSGRRRLDAAIRPLGFVPSPGGLVAGAPCIRVNEASGAVIRGDPKHRWPARPQLMRAPLSQHPGERSPRVHGKILTVANLWRPGTCWWTGRLSLALEATRFCSLLHGCGSLAPRPGGEGGNPYMTTSVDGGVLSRTGKGGGGGNPEATLGDPWHLHTCQNTPRLAPWCRTTRRCPVHWAAADFPRETTAL